MTILEESVGEHFYNPGWERHAKHAIKGRINKGKGLLELTTQ